MRDSIGSSGKYSGSMLRRGHFRRRSLRFALPCAAASLLLQGGCASKYSNTIARSPASFSAPDLDIALKNRIERQLTAGDVVTIRIYKVDSLSGDQTVDNAGRINLPLIGYVAAAGRTTAELESDLKQSLGTRYLTSPEISVTLKSAAQKTVTVDGSVQQPGIYAVEPNTTLVRTIAMAHGTTDDANPKRVVVFRQIDGQRMAASFDISSIRRGHSPDPKIYPDDVIIVDGSVVSKTFKTVLQTLPLATLFRPF